MGKERGIFITIEGIDGCGKSTQAALLCDFLEETHGRGSVLRTFEPGGWNGGALLRELLLGGTPVGARTELLLFLADRSGHVDAVILPALERGQWVVCERYT
ncbi:MAG: dTMP kinase, partial [Synergistaceae bacterium]|nr:dTMP kinase [Synergistaceae bacterium]